MLSIHCFAHLAVLSFELVSVWKFSFIMFTLSDGLARLLVSCSLKFWTSFCLEIFIYQVHTFRQTRKTTSTEPNFTCLLGHQTSIFTCPRAKLLALGNRNWVFSCPAIFAHFRLPWGSCVLLFPTSHTLFTHFLLSYHLHKSSCFCMSMEKSIHCFICKFVSFLDSIIIQIWRESWHTW